MLDLQLAKLRLKERKLTLVIAKAEKIMFETDLPGISGFLEAIKNLGEELVDAAVADKIVGRAIALLCVYAKVSAVFAEVISREGTKVLEKHGINFEFEDFVPYILDSKGEHMCPFEKFALEIQNSEEAYGKLKRFAESFSSAK